MEKLAFIYNLSLLFLYVFLLLVSFSAYKKTNNISYVYLSLLSICFILDLAFIFIYKFTNVDNISLYNNYRTILGLMMFICYIKLFTRILNKKINLFTIIPLLTILLLLYTNNIAPYNIITALFSRTCSFICLMELCIIYFAYYLIYNDQRTRKKAKEILPLIKIMLVTSVIGFFEGSLAVFDIKFFPEEIIQAFFYNCSISEDIYSIFFCIYIFEYINKNVSKINVFNILTSNNDIIPQNEIDKIKVEKFASKYKLSNREKEILLLIYQSYTNKEIAKKLFLSEGTIKTYSYKICQKTEAQNRNHLRKMLDLVDVSNIKM